jgi:hypothetical protein
MKQFSQMDNGKEQDYSLDLMKFFEDLKRQVVHWDNLRKSYALLKLKQYFMEQIINLRKILNKRSGAP